MTIDPTKIKTAKEWAEEIADSRQVTIRADALAAAARGLAATVIAQAEQIKRLQRASETALSEINDLDEETYNHMAGPFRPQGPSDYGLTTEDMEVTDE